MLTAKIKRKMKQRPYSFYGEDGRRIVLAPIVGKDGKVHRFILIDRGDEVSVKDREHDTYLRCFLKRLLEQHPGFPVSLIFGAP